MRTCLEDDSSNKISRCARPPPKKILGNALGVSGGVSDEKLFRGLKDAAEDAVTDAFAACVDSGQARDSSDCKAAKNCGL